MAAKFPSASDVQLRPRKGHDKTWSCDDHGEPIKFYCKEHNISICHPCATKDHQKPCQLDNIGDVILEIGTKLEDKRLEIEEMMQRLKRLDSEIQSCSAFVSHHLETVNDEVNIAYQDKIKSVENKEQEDIRLINEEADEEIRIINEKRERRVESCTAEAAKKQRVIQDTQAQLISDRKEIDVTVGKTIEGLKNKNQDRIDTMDNISSKIKRIKQEDKTLVNEAPQVIASLDESVSENVHQDMLDCLDHLKCEVQRVKFVERKMGGYDYTRIDGYIGKWELVKSLAIPSIINYPCVVGLISNDELCVLDGKNGDLYVSNISNRQTHKVIEGESSMLIISCAPVDSNLIVLGKMRLDCTGDSLDGCTTLYDRQWKVVRDITIPRNTCDNDSEVYADVDRDGMILVVENGQSNIYVINPADGKIVNTITMQDKEVLYGITSLSSGDIVVKTGSTEFTFISRSGEKKTVINCDELDLAWCRVDKLTDTLYITYADTLCDIFVVDQVSRDGEMEAKSIVDYKDSIRIGSVISTCLITPSGNLVQAVLGCNGDNILVYKKRFVL